jgi:hypothetical protein
MSTRCDWMNHWPSENHGGLRSAGGVYLISRFTTSLNAATPTAAPLAQAAVYLAVWEQWPAISFQAPFCC